MSNQLLPNFLIVGTAKAATTTIHEYLKQHPNIFMTDWKEPCFFVFKDKPNPVYTTDRPVSFVTTLEMYKSQFEKGKEHIVKGESSTPYLYFYNETIENIKKVYDNHRSIKILIVLRDPVNRAFSQYMMKVRDLVENLSFEEALESEDMRMKNNAHFDFFYRERGRYYNQVKAYLEEFDDVKIMFYEKFRNNEQEFLNEIVSFLGLEAINFTEIEKQNISGRPKIKWMSSILKDNPFKRVMASILPRKTKLRLKSFIMNKNLQREKIDENTRKALRKYYSEDITKLEKLIQTDLSHWK